MNVEVDPRRKTYTVDKDNWEEIKTLAHLHGILYEVEIGKSEGALIPIGEWLESVACGAFIDYDGIGDLVNTHGKLIGRTRPSDAKTVPTEASYILWYNR
jgi:hypothetical protein